MTLLEGLPGDLREAVALRAEVFARDRVAERIANRDHTVWKDDPAELANRMGWLDAPRNYSLKLGHIQRFADEVARDGFESVVLLGMGGSSLAPEVLHAIKGPVDGRPRLFVLDSTDPAQVLATEKAAGLERTLFVVASKSGNTIETMSQYAYFRERVPDASRYIAITDPASHLQGIAEAEGFRACFLNDPDIGGRFSALSYFGLVPAALCGLNIAALVDSAQMVQQAPGLELAGLIIGEAALRGRDKLTLLYPGAMASIGPWIEQLVAESSGKDGLGIVPVVEAQPGAPGVYGDDRMFIGAPGDALAAELRAAGHPVLEVGAFDADTIGAAFFAWEYWTAVACYVLGVNPFDQPNVQEAKDATNGFLAGGEVPDDGLSAAEALATVEEGVYIAINAFVTRNNANEALLARVQASLRDRYKVAVTIGYGPRFLHSTGQLHKGGPNHGVFLQVLHPDEVDVPIPGKDYTFGRLKRAQADGDLASLIARKRRVARLTLEELAELSGDA